MSYTYLDHKKLKLHPDNIRRFYPDEDVREMAESLAVNGLIQALIVTPTPDEPDLYYVVDGNMRLAGARQLGDGCPPLKCEIVEADHAAQLLIMAVTTERHYPKDPVSKALHYRRLMEQEGLSVEEIAYRLNCGRGTIYNTLKLLELDGDILALLSERQLSADQRLIRALLAVPDAGLRIKLARRFVKYGTSVTRAVAACNHVTRQSAEINGTAPRKIREPAQPALNGNGHQAGLDRPRIWDIAEKTLCDDCRLYKLGEQCYLCPGPYEFIQHMVELAETEKIHENK